MIFPYQEIYANILLYKSHAKFSGTLMKSITTEEEVAMNHTLNDDVNVELEYELIKMERKKKQAHIRCDDYRDGVNCSIGGFCKAIFINKTKI